MSKTFCPLPWIHLATRPNGDVRVCCTANASGAGIEDDKTAGLVKKDGVSMNLREHTIEEVWNSEHMRRTRLQMLNDEIPESCRKCFAEESKGIVSKRQWETHYWSQRVDLDKILADTQPDGEVPPNLAYIDLRFGTKCQLACVMCSPHDSSGWIKDYKKIFPDVQNESLKEIMQWNDKGSTNGSSYNWHKQNPTFWKQFYEQMPSMQQIYFAGGESLIIEEHYEILEHAIKMGYAKDLELRYNSNGVEWREDLFYLWKKFKLVRFHYSIDSIKEMNDYIRYPSDWANQVKTFHRLDNETSDNVEVTIACAVQALNVYYLPDFIQWKLEQKFKKVNMWPFGAGGISQHFVYWPAHLNVKSLPADFKAKCRAKYEAWSPWCESNWELGLPSWHKGKVDYEQWRSAEYGIKRLNGILSFMESEDWSQRLPEMKEFLGLCDKQRNNSFSSTFPEMKDIFKDA